MSGSDLASRTGGLRFEHFHLGGLGLAAGPERVNRHLLGTWQATLGELADTLQADLTAVRTWVEELVADELCTRAGNEGSAAPPHVAVSRLYARREEELRRETERLRSSRNRVDELLELYLSTHRTRVTEGLERLDSTEAVRAAMRHIAGRTTSSVLSVRDPGLLAPIASLLALVWSAAFALAPDVSDAAYDARIREVFQLLAHGAKGEA